MPNSTVTKVGNTLMVAIPSDLSRSLHLVEGSQVELAAEESRVVLRKSPKYSLDELLAQCDYTLPLGEEEREWLDAPAVGRELI